MSFAAQLPQAAPLPWASQSGDLPRQLASRDELAALLRRLFPAAGGALSPIQGGRAAALPLLEALDPAAYGPSRNHLGGAVTRLSPYVRHGIVGLAELRDRVVARSSTGSGSLKLLQQLAWRDYWQRLWQLWGDGIWENREALKTGLQPAAYAAALPADVRAAQTGLACMDGFIAELLGSGWLHNHARLWLASYLVHWRRLRWQAGAAWFLEHLLDGDPASNNLSWQWVASSFSSKPYIFNRANLERFGAGRYCAGCPAAAACQRRRLQCTR
ncbi:MAG: FAD-binding domain-containing protein [Prochlorococcaceae cyanobacterium]